MKTPFSYQKTNFDCAPTCLLNGISYLYQREEIPVEIINTIFKYTLDDFNERINIPGKFGTSRDAMNLISQKINKISTFYQMNLELEYITSQDVTLELIQKNFQLNPKSCIIWRTNFDGEHYVLITTIDKNFLYLFDPFYVTENDPVFKNWIKYANKKYYNRKINLSYLDQIKQLNFTLGPVLKREMLILKKITNKKVS